MSVGNFLAAFYESDTGDIHNITIQPETAALVIGTSTNTIPAGPANNEAPINVSRGRKSKGLSARKIRVRILTAGTSGLQVGSVIALPWLNPTTFLSVTRPGRQTGNYYLGSTVEVVGGSPEVFVTR